MIKNVVDGQKKAVAVALQASQKDAKGGPGKGGGKNKDGQVWQTEDGQKICYAFQKGTCQRKECKFLHVCVKCHQVWKKCECH